MKIASSTPIVSASLAFALAAAAPVATAAPPSKNHRVEVPSGTPNFLPVLTEMSRLFTVEQMFKIRGLVKEYNPRAEPIIDRLIDANRQLSAAVIDDETDLDAVRHGADAVADAREEMALLQARFFNDVKAISTPDQVERMKALHTLAFERAHKAVDRLAWAVATF